MPLDGNTEEVVTLDGEDVSAFPGNRLAGSAAVRFETASVLLARTRVPGRRNCRACMVEIEGERVLAASCIQRPVKA